MSNSMPQSRAASLLPFTKMQGAGNDFVVLDAAELDWPALAPLLCDRHFGVGADGLLILEPSEVAAVRMRMYNPDGTEDQCGNGLRCLALYAHSRGAVRDRKFTIETISGVKKAVINTEGPAASVTVDLGRATLEAATIPLSIPPAEAGSNALGLSLSVGGAVLKIHSLSTGTPHTVIFELPDEARFQRLSPLLEHHPLFPERTSVMWTEVQSRDRARVRIWERGAGETLACGTGACAVAVAGMLSGRTDARVTVQSRGGELTIEVAPDLQLRMTGPAAFVMEGEFALPMSNQHL